AAARHNRDFPFQPVHVFTFSLYLTSREWPRLPFTARLERPSSFSMILPSLLASLPWNGTRVDPTAAVEQGYS
ncbi:MAG: hypothetical protein ACREI1_12875, partial [Nitrospiraceae bacterium]